MQPKGEVIPGYCIRISTGAPLPPGADAVVQVEDTKLTKDADGGRVELEIEVMTSPAAGQDIRSGKTKIKCSGQKYKVKK